MASCEIQSGEFKIAGGTLTVTKLPAGRSKILIQIDGAPQTELLLNENGYAIEPPVAIKPAPATAGSATTAVFSAPAPEAVVEVVEVADEPADTTPAWKRKNR